MLELTLIQKIAIFALPVLLAITLHEAAHGYVARMFGDTTAEAAGRITVNPLKHVDMVGTILVPLVILVASKLLGGAGMLFGWAKPVPVNFGRLRRPKQDMLWVAAAGPGSNFIQAILWGVLIQVALVVNDDFASQPLVLMGAAGVFINVILMALNLLPLPPLDGGRITVSLLPVRQAIAFSKLEPWGMVILLGLLFSGILALILGPLIGFFVQLIALLTGLDGARLIGLINYVLT